MLSYEQIAEIFSVRRGAVTESHLLGCARAIEAAACAERDACIAELERELAEARKDAELYEFIASACEVFHDGKEIGDESELRAAMKGQ